MGKSHRQGLPSTQPLVSLVYEAAEDKTNEYRFTEDTALLSRSFKYYTGIQEEIKRLSEEKQPKKKAKKGSKKDPF